MLTATHALPPMHARVTRLGRDLVRYGPRGASQAEYVDGSKLLCRLGDQEENGVASNSRCVIVSMGSRGDFSFERVVLKQTRCEVHTYDWQVAHTGFPSLHVHTAHHTYMHAIQDMLHTALAPPQRDDRS